MVLSYVLIVVLLAVDSNFAAKPHVSIEGKLDTVQYWFTPNSSWKITTFTANKDIQINALEEPVADSEYQLDAAVADTKKRYGEAIQRIEVLELDDPFDVQAALAVLSDHNLDGELELDENGVIFYNPDNGYYLPGSKGMVPATP